MNDGIAWAEVGSGGRFEKIVSVLISTLHPHSQRIDGSGGDGGRDHQLISKNRTDLWQSKYFLNRLSESRTRKPQIEASLNAAAANQPDSWTLVTPMVPNPEELAWFNKLKPEYPFELVWRGADWLDANLAMHPGIVRHFMGENDRYVALLRELRAEQEAGIDGLPAARERLESLADRINDANPFYKVDFSLVDGQLNAIALRPKYCGAETESPIQGRFSVVIGDSPVDKDLKDRLEAAMDWGESVEIPSEYIRELEIDAPHGLGARGANDDTRIILGPAGPDTITEHLQLLIRDSHDALLASLPVKLTERVRGQRGVTLKGADHTGIVTIRLRFDSTDFRMNANLSVTDQPTVLPASLLPVLRFLDRARYPNRLYLKFGTCPEITSMDFPNEVTQPETSLNFIEELVQLQGSTNYVFELPARWTRQDELETHRAVQLSNGERVQFGSQTIRFSMEDSRLIEELLKEGAATYSLNFPGPDYTAEICGHTLDLGPTTLFLRGATVVLERAADGSHSVRVDPSTDFGIEAELGQHVKSVLGRADDSYD